MDEQIARAQRFAQAVNSNADRERFGKMARDYQNELQAVEAAEGQPAATASGGAAAAGDGRGGPAAGRA
ncbi:hypothetical protein [Bradyrhizobium sp. USDA 3650]